MITRFDSETYWKGVSRKVKHKVGESIVRTELALNGFTKINESREKGFNLEAENEYGEKFTFRVRFINQAKDYAYFNRDDMNFEKGYFLALVRCVDGENPELYIIPTDKWLEPNSMFRERKREYALNITRRNESDLEQYQSDRVLCELAG